MEEVDSMRFVIRKSKNGEFYWQLVGSNGEVMAQSETMTRKQTCMDSVASVQKNAGDAEVVDKSEED
jgi:uncharacterized protein YegP (UPF0339 family)